MKAIQPTEVRGPGYAQKTLPGTGLSKGSNGHGGGEVSNVHHRPQGHGEFSQITDGGTDYAKS